MDGKIARRCPSTKNSVPMTCKLNGKHSTGHILSSQRQLLSSRPQWMGSWLFSVFPPGFYFFLCDRRSVGSDSLQPHRLQPARLLCPWNSPVKNPGVGCHSLLQGILLTHGSNQGFQHWREILYHLNHKGSPIYIPQNILIFSNKQPFINVLKHPE